MRGGAGAVRGELGDGYGEAIEDRHVEPAGCKFSSGGGYIQCLNRSAIRRRTARVRSFAGGQLPHFVYQLSSSILGSPSSAYWGCKQTERRTRTGSG